MVVGYLRLIKVDFIAESRGGIRWGGEILLRNSFYGGRSFFRFIPITCPRSPGQLTASAEAEIRERSRASLGPRQAAV
jgi:hypothetical protein